MFGRNRYLGCFFLATTAICGPVLAGDLPKGGSVAHGKVNIGAAQSGRMAIKQSSDKAIINWQGFSIGKGNRVDISQPGRGSTMLNRVTGSTPSTIAGQLNANGQVYLVNPNGIAITRSGTIRTGAFVGSTLNISDEDFVNGQARFRGNGRSAAVSNGGVIEIGRGGYAALVGGKVSNSGVVSVPMGRIGLGAGERATLDLSGDGFLQVSLPSENGDDGALVSNSGRLSADGGRVELRAAAARNAARQAINMSGVVEARTVSGRNGHVILGGSGGRVAVSGTIDARAPEVLASPAPIRRAIGGSVDVTGTEITLTGAKINVSGVSGGGQVRIGGDFQGGPALPAAENTIVDGATLIRSDATQSGDGGRVIIWADGRTDFAGHVSAKGGASAGDGGFVEVSGKAKLAFSGDVVTTAAKGRTGTLLLDPYNVIITDEGETDPAYDDNDYYPGGEDSIVNSDDLVDLLESTNITIWTDNDSQGNQLGDITVDSELSWASANYLELVAENNIIINDEITAPSGRLWLNAQGQITTSPSGAIDVGEFILQDGDWIQNSASLPEFSAGNFLLNGGTFRRVAGGSGTLADPYLLTDIYGLQGIESSDSFLAQHYALTGDIDASGTSGWVESDVEVGLQQVGFDSIGEYTSVGDGGFSERLFTGSLDGRGYAIDGLSVGGLDSDYVGLFAATGPGAVIADVELTDVSVRGENAGALIGWNLGTVSDASSSGNVIGAGDVGGLVGFNEGTVERSFSAADVSASDESGSNFGFFGGGLVGYNSGRVEHAYATGDVSVLDEPVSDFSFFAGGLVGYNGGGVEHAYATGNVTASVEAWVYAGGLVGLNSGEIVSARASGPVDAFGDPYAAVGGLVGENYGSITRAYATGAVDAAVGGEFGFANVGGLVGYNAGPISQTYSTGTASVFGVRSAVGGLVGFNSEEGSSENGEGGGTVEASFWDVQTSGLTSSDGGVGLTTAQFLNRSAFMSQAEAAGWSFQDHWAPSGDGFYPELYALSPVVWVDVNDATRQYGRANPAFTAAGVYGGPGYYVFGPDADTLDVASGLSTSATRRSDVGNYAIDAAGGEFTSAFGQLYRAITMPGTLSVTRAPLIITANDATKTYGDTLTFTGQEFAANGLRNGDQVTSVDLASYGAAPTANVGDGPFVITGSGAQGDLGGNYAISYVPGTLTVTPAPLVIAATDLVKRLGDVLIFAGTEFTVRGLRNGDEITSVSLSSPGAAAGAGLAGSPYEISIADAIGMGLVNETGDISNYNITYVPGMLDVLADGPEADENLPRAFTLVTQLNNIVNTVRNPDDIIQLGLADRADTEATLDVLEGLTSVMAEQVAECEQADPGTGDYLTCLQNALEFYAAQLEDLVVDLPEPLQNVPAFINRAIAEIDATRAQAQNRIAAAATPEEAIAIERQALEQARESVQTAIGEVQKSIDLIRAGDSEFADIEVEQGNEITVALQTVDLGLSRAVGL
ncbi:MBG domain-containing protein [Qingshengfaniella alkalisoli]|uniref:Filamentous hemagglutinin N-terminal domain-containing protein n=1 Tax=Qingshengfaniella alkalisoli TaxID=2599296 RepID=A0A5B8IBT4_9RHOB|nr:MBG domain-containing protein [Qingshengfaniella alkalisoli]QDY70936.1 filamentous hemagglutinin N-terminal domain-containing protein [Qingshengfaniella alkalisoli]